MDKITAKECEICEQIVALFRYDVEQNKATELGVLQTILQDSSCGFHSRLIREALGNQLAKERNVSTLHAIRQPDPQLQIQFLDDGGNESAVSVQTLTLLSTDSAALKATGRYLDPHWTDLDLIKTWKTTCERLHGASCPPQSTGRSPISWPLWLVDCTRQCLVPGTASLPYIAVSYVWGGVESLKTTTMNLVMLQKDGALCSPELRASIPQIIKDAIALTPLLGERYLWVDSICIVQDDMATKTTELLKMASIYTNSSLTVIATGGDANHGLRGIPGISSARNYQQDLFALPDNTTLGFLDIKYGYFPGNNVWASRGWTHQEQLFSRRCLYFPTDANRTIHWKCQCSEWQEDSLEDEIYPTRLRNDDLSLSHFPNLERFGMSVWDYNNRLFTYPEDIHDAIAGSLYRLSTSFRGGFISGLPLVFFDVAMLWQPKGPVIRRHPKLPGSRPQPSWSWMGWQGSIDAGSWCAANRYFKNSKLDRSLFPSRDRVIPLVKWQYRVDDSQDWVEVTHDWYILEQAYFERDDTEPPNEWYRCENPGTHSGSNERTSERKYFYKHRSDPESEFWYPVPLVEDVGEPFVSKAQLVSCLTQRCWLQGSEQIFPNREHTTVSVRDTNGRWVGALQLHENIFGETPWSENTLAGTSLELVAVARGECKGFSFKGVWATLDEWDHPERPTSEGADIPYEYYHVLWIEWHGKIAHRKALGRIEKRAWEAQQLEWIDLILG